MCVSGNSLTATIQRFSITGHNAANRRGARWIPAFAGMRGRGCGYEGRVGNEGECVTYGVARGGCVAYGVSGGGSRVWRVVGRVCRVWRFGRRVCRVWRGGVRVRPLSFRAQPRNIESRLADNTAGTAPPRKASATHPLSPFGCWILRCAQNDMEGERARQTVRRRGNDGQVAAGGGGGGAGTTAGALVVVFDGAVDVEEVAGNGDSAPGVEVEDKLFIALDGVVIDDWQNDLESDLAGVEGV